MKKSIYIIGFTIGNNTKDVMTFTKCNNVEKGIDETIQMMVDNTTFLTQVDTKVLKSEDEMSEIWYNFKGDCLYIGMKSGELL